MRKLSLVLAGATSLVLGVMVVVGLSTGAAQEPHEWFLEAPRYIERLLEHPGALRVMFGLDIGFLILYTAFFAAFAAHLRALGRPFTRLAFGLILATAILDVVEDHHILTLLAMAEQNERFSDAAIAFQQVLSSTKFTLSFLGLFMFGLAIPRTTRLGVVLVVFLTVFNLATAVIGYTVPPAIRDQLDSGRWVGFLIGFGLVAAWLRTSSDP